MGTPFFLRPRQAAPGHHQLDVDNAVVLSSDGSTQAPPRLPLHRKPKNLDIAPNIFRRGTGLSVVAELNPVGGAEAVRSVAGQPVVFTTQVAEQKDLSTVLGNVPPDPAVATMAHAILRNLSMHRRSRDALAQRGAGALVSVPFAYRTDDIDLHRTLEMLAACPVPEDTDIIVRERMRSSRAAILIIDLSGSMRGEKVQIAAATVAALSAELSGVGDRLAVVAFWSDAAVVKGFTETVSPSALLDTLMRIEAAGLTNVSFGLSVALAELSTAVVNRRTAVLLTDAVHNAGPDPRDLAGRFPELHVLLETDDECDIALGRELARCGHGTMTPVRAYRDVAPALNRIFNR